MHKAKAVQSLRIGFTYQNYFGVPEKALELLPPSRLSTITLGSIGAAHIDEVVAEHA